MSSRRLGALAGFAVVVACIAFPMTGARGESIPVAGQAPCVSSGDAGRDGPANKAVFNSLDGATLSIAVNNAGDIFIADSFWLRVIRRSRPDWIQTLAGDRSGSDTPWTTLSMEAIAVDSSQNPVVMDFSSGHMQIRRFNGSSLQTIFEDAADTFTNPAATRALAASADGLIYYTTADGLQMLIPQQSYRKQQVTAQSIPAKATSLAIDDTHGKLYVSGFGGSVVEVDLHSWQSSVVGSPLTGNVASHVAVDPQSQTLFVASADPRLAQVDLKAPSKSQPLLAATGTTIFASGLAVLPTGGGPKLLVAGSGYECNIQQFDPLPPPEPVTTKATVPATAPPTSTATTVPDPSPPGSVPVLEAPTAHVGNVQPNVQPSTDLVNSGGDLGQAGAATPDPGSVSQVFGARSGSSLFSPTFDGGFNLTAPGGPNQGALFTPDGGFLTAPSANGVGGVATPPVGPPSPTPSPGTVGQLIGGTPPPPLGGGPLNPSPGLGVAPGQPWQPATRYAMVRNNAGGSAAPIVLFGLGGCMVLFGLGLGLKGDRGGPQGAPAPAKAWAIGR